MCFSAPVSVALTGGGQPFWTLRPMLQSGITFLSRDLRRLFRHYLGIEDNPIGAADSKSLSEGTRFDRNETQAQTQKEGFVGVSDCESSLLFGNG